MADPIVSVSVDASKAIAKLGRMDAATRTALRGVIVVSTQQLAALVRAKLSGQVLQKRSGRLFDSIQSQMFENTAGVFGRVFSQGVPYARIHEYGGVINHPGSSKFQAWQNPGGWVFTHYTRPHKIPMPERSYMRSSLAEIRDEVLDRMRGAVKSAAKAA